MPDVAIRHHPAHCAKMCSQAKSSSRSRFEHENRGARFLVRRLRRLLTGERVDESSEGELVMGVGSVGGAVGGAIGGAGAMSAPSDRLFLGLSVVQRRRGLARTTRFVDRSQRAAPGVLRRHNDSAPTVVAVAQRLFVGGHPARADAHARLRFQTPRAWRRRGRRRRST